MSKRKKPRRRPPPAAVDERSKRGALRTIAGFEAFKGAMVLAAGFGVLTLLHKDVNEVANHMVHVLHLRPEGHLSEIFLRAADKVTDAKLWAAAGGALAYSTVRFVEAYGLWNARVWAEWFALLSGAMYLPWEIVELIAKPTPIRALVFASNLAIVVYMAYVRWRASRPLAE
ncbi:MAG: DUF2127 domain-containing protein [Acidobacteria bacterium]|nr:DUF2127 domain-containing protein [Acidobacteriota bacterium]